MATWGDLGHTMFMPRVNIQHLYIDIMGVEEGILLFMITDIVEKYFQVLSEAIRLIKVINESPISD